MNRKLSTVVLLAGFIAFSGQVLAKKDPMTEMLTKQLKASLAVMNDPEIIKANAKYIRNLYDALIAEGFSKEQALQLVSASISSKK